MNLNLGTNIRTDNVGLGLIRRLTDVFRAAKSDSLIDYTSVTRVEPICIVDGAVINNEMVPEVMQSLQSIFSGYYLQAMAISTNVGRIEVMRHLDKLNPKRSPIDSAADTAGWLMSMESYEHRLPMPRTGYAAEAERARIESESVIDREQIPQIHDLTNLSVGKMLKVEITDGNHRASVPVAIRLMASSIPSADLVHILSSGNKDKSMKERYHGWREGRLDFVRDIILCQDLIDAHKKNLMNDKSGLYSEILNRRRGNGLSTLLSGNPSVATASNLVVMSKETVDRLEMETGMAFKDFKSREKIFKETYMMIVAVIDPQWDRVTFYFRGMAETTSVGIRDLKVANKSTGPDVSEILKAFQLGSAPSL